MTIKHLLPLLLIMFLAACEDVNHGFCSRYSYIHKQITDNFALPPEEIEHQLKLQLARNIKPEQARMELLVVEDVIFYRIPRHEEPRDYCLRTQAWKRLDTDNK